MPKPYTHFSREEFSQRQQKTRKHLQKLELDGLLLFKIEDMYWLTGYESDGFCIFTQVNYTMESLFLLVFNTTQHLPSKLKFSLI